MQIFIFLFTLFFREIFYCKYRSAVLALSKGRREKASASIYLKVFIVIWGLNRNDLVMDKLVDELIKIDILILIF